MGLLLHIQGCECAGFRWEGNWAASISRRQNLLVESVCARAICPPSSADAAKSGQKSCSRSVEIW